MARPKKHNADKFYFSERLSEKLDGLLWAKTTLICAPAGYGKTTAAREHLNKRLPKTAALRWLTCVEEPAAAAWRRFCDVIQTIDAEAGRGLLAIGLPDDDTKGDVATLIMEMECRGETWLVIDDFHSVKDAVPGTVWDVLMEHGAKNLHTVILTKAAVEMRMTQKPGVLYLKRDDMRLTEDEIGEYFEQAGVALTPAQIREANRHTEGWITALNLQRKSYLDTGAFLDTGDIHEMMREIVWNRLTENEQSFLLRVSPFDSYTLVQAAYMMDADKLPEYAKALNEKNDFIRRDPWGLVFRPHSTLLHFTRGVLDTISVGERAEILTRAGDWCAGNKQPEQAMYFYHRLGDYKKILALDVLGIEFERADGADYADMLLDILENTTPGEKLARSVSVIKIIFMLFGAGRYEQFGRWCGELTAIVAESDLPETEKNRLAGELALLTSFTKFNNIAEMGGLIRRADELLCGKPSLISMNDAWTFGSPSVLFLYHSEAGRLDGELADMDENAAHYFSLTRGHGSGGDVLMKAEALFNRGEMSLAPISAYKALYRAENRRQECVCIGAALLLGRLALRRGDSDEFADILEQRILRYAEKNPLKSNRMEADLATSCLMQLLDRPQDMAGWLRHGDLGDKRLYDVTLPYAQILYGKYLLGSGSPDIWLGMAGEAMALAEKLRCGMAEIYGGILTAAAYRAQDMTGNAAAALKGALDLALPDRLYMPFAENHSLLGILLDEHCPQGALKCIISLAEKQEAGKAAILRKLYPLLPFGLTQREYDVAKLAARNLTSPEIAENLYISLNTVKTHIKNIYQKTQASSRSELNKIFEKI
ncbi:MAG: LuxR C-terminal-related transcriptional regulator [Gracilibacteraceae bacterium]|jgi:LuxR family maltose regulon positive regulatory protein|nr:LuxR C-terminal-related transcriptional regulator [Gracilibacteraceae bacterium]